MEKIVLAVDKFWISPYSFSSYVALTEKNIAFEIEEIALDEQKQRALSYVKTSYTGRVPSLRFGSFSLAESSAIAEFLEDNFPDKGTMLFPKNLRDRAVARMVMAWLRSDFAALKTECPTHSMFYAKEKLKLSVEAQSDANRLINFCERMVKPNGCFFNEWSLAAAELSFMLHRLILNDHQIPRSVFNFAKLNWERTSIQAFVEHPRPTYVPY